MPLVQHASLRALALLATCALAAVVALVGPAAGRPLVHAQDGDGTPPFDPVDFGVGLEAVAGGFERPVHVADPGDGSGRLFVVEQAGRIRIVRDGEVLPEPFLDIVEIVESGGNEQGLLSVAFHPDYADNGLFYVGFTARTTDDEDDSVGDNTVARYRVSADDPDRADPDSREVLLAVDDPYPNHNGGLVLFGPDGYLYAGLGDGGSGGDPEGNGQNTDTLLGSILRLDVDGAADGEPYAIPADNPFADGDGGAPEVWTYGLRNPWRFSFDRATGDLYVADVGQNQMWLARYTGFRQPNSHVSSGGLGTMGFSVPAAMGAALGRPDRETWAITGDGGFQMTFQELMTLVQDRIPVKIAVFDNKKLGMIRQWQEIIYAGNYHSATLLGPDFLKLAEAFGIPAWKATKTDEVDDTIRAAQAVDGPALVWFEIAEEQNVFPMMPAGKGLSDLIEKWEGADE